jgi:hypothetical protein
MSTNKPASLIACDRNSEELVLDGSVTLAIKLV